MLKPFHTKDKIEIGIDEAGRGCLMGPVCVAAVVLNPECDVSPPYEIKDSKKCSEKKKLALREYIETYSIAYSVKMISVKEIDSLNILQATMKGMHQCIDDIRKTLEPDSLLVDGTYFNYYMTEDMECIPHHCIAGGDDTYQSIAAASILAKTYRDEYMKQLVNDNPILQEYEIEKNKGYGTKRHMDALKTHGVTKYHRRSFKPCQK